MKFGDIVRNFGGDFFRGFRVPVEDMAIAALVMLPFTFAVTLWVNSMMAWGTAGMVFSLGVLVELAGTFWNAGWRARTAMAVVPVPANGDE
ncbi:MAG: hypothetical protein U1E59_01590 [Amaricoccus sp.]